MSALQHKAIHSLQPRTLRGQWSFASDASDFSTYFTFWLVLVPYSNSTYAFFVTFIIQQTDRWRMVPSEKSGT